VRRAVLISFALLVAGCGDDPSAAPRAETRPYAAWEMRDAAAEAGLIAVIRSGTAKQEHIPEVKGLGVGLLDYDGDGKLDILFTSGSSVERAQKGEPGFGCFLYRNETAPGGPLRFRDATAEAKIPATKWAGGPAVGDYDGDGWPDVLITGMLGNVLLRNRGDGTFEDATARAGIGGAGWTTGAAFGDLDQDGDLDLYVARYLDFDLATPPRHGGRFTCMWKQRVVMCGPRGLPPQADVAWRNDGDGTFTDATADWGFDQAEPQYGLGVVIGDLTGDGRPDVFVANDSSPNHLFENDGGKFVDRALERGVAYSEDGREMAGMGVDAHDWNRDGIPEIVVTNFSDQPNSVFVSQGPGRWFESSRPTGVALASYPMLSWGVGIQDFDDDGFADIFVASGHVYVAADEPGTDTKYRQTCQLFRSDGQGKFEDVSARLGPGFREPHVGRGAAFGDLDQDGDVDVVVVNLNERPSLFENRRPPGNASLSVALEQPGKNREALGARITAIAGGRSQSREVRRSYSFLASSDVRAHFGLGTAKSVQSIEVTWPDGGVEHFSGAAAGRVTLKRGGGTKVK
jgi:enediyne biosynthesis protein E4